MAKPGRPRKKPPVRRRLYYDGIELIPVAFEIPYSLCWGQYCDSWHLPGREIATTRELVARAKARGVTLTLAEDTLTRSSAVSLI